jgi:hypothetical protein
MSCDSAIVILTFANTSKQLSGLVATISARKEPDVSSAMVRRPTPSRRRQASLVRQEPDWLFAFSIPRLQRRVFQVRPIFSGTTTRRFIRRGNNPSLGHIKYRSWQFQLFLGLGSLEHLGMGGQLLLL